MSSTLCACVCVCVCAYARGLCVCAYARGLSPPTRGAGGAARAARLRARHADERAAAGGDGTRDPLHPARGLVRRRRRERLLVAPAKDSLPPPPPRSPRHHCRNPFPLRARRERQYSNGIVRDGCRRLCRRRVRARGGWWCGVAVDDGGTRCENRTTASDDGICAMPPTSGTGSSRRTARSGCSRRGRLARLAAPPRGSAFGIATEQTRTTTLSTRHRFAVYIYIPPIAFVCGPSRRPPPCSARAAPSRPQPTPQRWVDAATGEPVSGLLPGAWAPCSEKEFVDGFVNAMDMRGASAAAAASNASASSGGGGGGRRSFSEVSPVTCRVGI